MSCRVQSSLPLWTSVLLLTLGGCFTKKYEQRFEVTKKIFEHTDTVNRNVGSAWEDMGMSLRVPKQYELMPPPQPPEPPADKDAPPPDPPPDLRQPDFLREPLPGLMGAWKAVLKTSVNNQPTEHASFLYVLGNQGRLAARSNPDAILREEPLKFQEDAVNMLARNLNVTIADNNWSRKTFPKDYPYVPKVEYDFVRLEPEGRFAGAKMTFDLYIHHEGDIQVLVLFVLPEGIDSTEKMQERIDICLETLTTSSVAVGTTSGSTSGGAPAGGF